MDYLEPMGAGALAIAFEQLKKKLAAQGVFDEKLKRRLPFLPQRVAVITSPTGAAVRDFLKVVFRRFANIEIIVVPVRVQGEGAAEDMVKAIKVVNSLLKADVIVLTRGGGSLEDLWAFNQEALALAIRDSDIPVVSAVGHEIDLTISDLAADFRAPTPSAAAELLVAEKETLCKQLEEMRSRLVSKIDAKIRSAFQDLDRAARALGDPRRRLSDHWMRLDDLAFRLVRSVQSLLEERRRRLGEETRALALNASLQGISKQKQSVGFHRRSLCLGIRRIIRERRMTLSYLEGRVQGLNPLSILRRGYSVTRRLPEGTVLRDVSTVKGGDRVHVLLSEGAMECRVEKVDPDETFKGPAADSGPRGNGGACEP